jgi:hypothetical protein
VSIHDWIEAPQDHDLVGLRAPEAAQDQDTAPRQADEGPDHTRPPPAKASLRRRIVVLGQVVPLVTARIDFWHPTRGDCQAQRP